MARWLVSSWQRLRERSDAAAMEACSNVADTSTLDDPGRAKVLSFHAAAHRGLGNFS